ncbi:MAG: nitrate reductase catalytic [Beijerinckiaceae bacterium]|nr:MAG: nitrate reductase catalytic [Beijerinckiaceae bacterium]
MDASATTRTTCPYCGVGCGVLATREVNGTVSIKGDPDHPANFGRLCSKGTALGETLGLEGRLLHPEISGTRASWNEALDLVASRLSRTIAEHGPDSVAFYVSGQLLTEDYYLANKLMKGFIGSGNIDTNSRLCMASSVAAHRRAFGADTVPASYADLDEADLIVLVGSNFAWCHPVLFQRVLAARAAKGTRLIVIDPRRTMTAEAADLHLALEPDQDVPLFLGLLRHLDAEGLRDQAYTEAHVEGLEAALATAAPVTIEVAAGLTGLDTRDIAGFYTEFATTRKVVTIFSQGVNQSVTGTDKANAIINCHLLTGRIGKPGASPFSITGQPNAMGGREVGGLANVLAAHMAIEDAAARNRVQRFWASPAIADKPGLKAVEMFRAVAEGRIKAIWIMATNPADSLPEADGVQEALRACPFVVVSDVNRHTDTTRFAHVLLPAAAWGEKDGTVTNSERRISRQRGFLPLPGEAQPDWWQLAEVGRRMGFSGFDYPNVAAIFREHAALSAFENAGSRDFDIGAYADVTDAGFDALPPFQWPQPAGTGPQETRFFADGRFFHTDGKARMIATPVPALSKPRSEAFPLWLNTGRIRDQWHTMTRTAKASRLMGHYGEPFCEIHPDDAEAAGITAASLVTVTSTHGSVIVRALITDRQRRGSVFLPMHWTDQFAARARADALVNAAVDPVSGQPGSKRTPVTIVPFAARWYGFAVSAIKPDASAAPYWALATAPGGYRLELAGLEVSEDWQAFARTLFGHEAETGEWIAYFDREAGIARLAMFANDRLIGALFVGPKPVALARGFITDALPEAHAGMARFRLLAGQGGADRPDPGAIICACFQVGVNQIAAAIRDGNGTLETIGAALKAGTNCGSCRSDIRRMLDDPRLATAV